MTFWMLLLILVLQRLQEVRMGERNIALHKSELIRPPLLSEKREMFILHVSWFTSMIVEHMFHGALVSPFYFILGVLVLCGCQFVRFQSMSLLGQNWVHLPVAFKNQKIVDSGIYRLIRHPNYLVVIIEIAVVPLLGGAIFTALFFSVLNFLFIWRRIGIEESSLNHLENYRKAFHMKKRLIPFLFSWILVHSVWGDEIQVKNEKYEQATQEPNYFKFIGKSSKIGIITTSFEGYAKSFSIHYETLDSQIKNVLLSFSVHDLDTDNNARNEKMWETCLSFKEFPTVEVKVLDPIRTDLATQDLKAEMAVRGQKIPLILHFTKTSEGEFSGQSSFKLSDAKIPDPSILVASVKDEFKIEFHVKLKPEQVVK